MIQGLSSLSGVMGLAFHHGNPSSLVPLDYLAGAYAHVVILAALTPVLFRSEHG